MENFRLKVFRVVARNLNFRKASEELFISQPAVTQHVKALEEQIGTALFDRTNGKVTLTESGLVLLGYAEKLKALSDEALQALSEVSGVYGGELNVGASRTIGQYLLPNLLAAFLREQPQVQVTTMSGNTDEMLTALADHRIHVALIEGPDGRRDIQTEAFMEDHMVLVVPANHAWADHEIDPTNIRDAPLLVREIGSGSRRVVEDALAAAGINNKDLRIAMTLDSTEGLLSAVEAGLGVAFVSRWAVRNQLTLGTLKLARIRNLNLRRVLSIARLAGPVPQGSVGAFHKFLLQHSYDAAPRFTGHAAKK